MIQREEFDAFHNLVQAVFDEGRQRTRPTLRTVTDSPMDCPVVHQSYIEGCESLGLSMQDVGKSNEFHIWLTPQYKKPSFKFYMTLAHELTHGYAGLQYGHAAQWRRWFYRVLWHLANAGHMPKSESDLGLVCFTVEQAYNYAGTDMQMHTTIQESFNKARSEHPRVLENYWKRIHA